MPSKQESDIISEAHLQEINLGELFSKSSLCNFSLPLLLFFVFPCQATEVRVSLMDMRYCVPIILLFASNIFMTFAWYGHLKFKSLPLWIVILLSWSIAFFEYCLQVPANRFGHTVFSATQLKVMQEVITLIVFAFFSVLYLKEKFKWNYLVGFLFLLLAVFFVFKKWD